MDAQQQSILQVAIDKGRMSVAGLAKMAGVLETTIHQDLNLLEKQSYLCHTHGYAVPLGNEGVETRMTTCFVIKRELASRATALASASETVFIENGSSNTLLAHTLAEYDNIATITVSSCIAYLLKEAPGEVILLGRIYRKRSENMAGPLTRQSTQQVHFSKAFIGIDNWQAETGFTGRDMIRTDMVNTILEKHCEVIILSDSSKSNVVHPHPLGPAGCFNRVITDGHLPTTYRDQLLHSDLTIDIIPYV